MRPPQGPCSRRCACSVDVFDLPCMVQAAAPDAHIRDGCLVVLVGLQKPENNGRQGHVLGLSEETGRYQVKLLSGNTVKIKPENVEVVLPRERKKEPEVAAAAPTLRERSRSQEKKAQFPSEWLRQLQQENIYGIGSQNGRPPRGAGVVALRRAPGAPGAAPEAAPEAARAHLYVCVVEKAPKWPCAKCRMQSYNTWTDCCMACYAPRPNLMTRYIPGSGMPGPQGFPKGGMEPEDRGSLVLNACREWEQETGISRVELRIIPGVHFDDSFVGVRLLLGVCDNLPGDLETSWAPPEANMMCPNGHRLKAQLATPVQRSCSSCQRPLVESTDRRIICCDPCGYVLCKTCKDPDPIVLAQWMHVDKARRLLKEERRAQLNQAVEAFIESEFGVKTSLVLGAGVPQEQVAKSKGVQLPQDEATGLKIKTKRRRDRSPSRSHSSSPSATASVSAPAAQTQSVVKMCQNFVGGTCTKGETCDFAHGEDELQAMHAFMARGGSLQ